MEAVRLSFPPLSSKTDFQPLQVLADLHRYCIPAGSTSGTSSEDQSRGTTCAFFPFPSSLETRELTWRNVSQSHTITHIHSNTCTHTHSARGLRA
jgi:hypothetical protein